MRRSLAWCSAPVSFAHVPSWADFITITVGFRVFGTHTEDTFLQERVAPIPEGQRETESLQSAAKAGEAVLVPAVGARARMFIGKILPCLAVGAVILSHGAPGTLADIGSDRFP